MDLLQKLFVVVLSSSFIFPKMIVNGTREPYPTNASVGLTDNIQNTSMLVLKLKEIFPPNGTTSRDGRSFEFPCDSKTCLSVCCASGKAYLDGNCVEDNHTYGFLPQTNLPSQDNMHLLTRDPCDVSWLYSTESKDFEIFANGTIYARRLNKEGPFDLDHHCLFRKPNSEIYLAKLCDPWVKVQYFQVITFLFVSFVMLTIFIGYSVTPELKNLHGMVFRAYLATYICAHISTVSQQYTIGLKRPHLFIFFVIGSHYGAGACALWFNVMCFNIWRTFRGLQPTAGKMKEQERKKFISYAIYAWLTPAVLHTITTLIQFNVPFFRDRPLNRSLILWCCASLLVIMVIVNTILYSLTVFQIRKHQKETAHLTNGMNKHQKEEKQRVNLHVKLFMITGCHTTSWAIWELLPSLGTTIIVLVVEIVQCSLLFYIYIWKDNVKKAIRQRFTDAVIRLQSIFGISHKQISQKNFELS